MGRPSILPACVFLSGTRSLPGLVVAASLETVALCFGGAQSLLLGYFQHCYTKRTDLRANTYSGMMETSPISLIPPETGVIK